MLSLLKKGFAKLINSEDLDQRSEDIDGHLIDIAKKLHSTEISVVFDIGAHQGRYSKAINQKLNEAEIYCFEPFPETFQVLRQNLTSSIFHLYPLAISNIQGKTPFYSNFLDETNSLLPSSDTKSEIDVLISNKEIIEVDVITLDEFCKQKNIGFIDILKIDAQGNTLNVLKGAGNLLLNKRIKIIQCEVEFLEIYKGQFLFHHVASFLESSKYSLYSLYNLHYDVNNRLSWADAIYYIENDNDVNKTLY